MHPCGPHPWARWQSKFPTLRCVSVLWPFSQGDTFWITALSLCCLPSHVCLPSCASWLQLHQMLPEWWFRNSECSCQIALLPSLAEDSGQVANGELWVTVDLGQTWNSDVKRQSSLLPVPEPASHFGEQFLCCLLATSFILIDQKMPIISRLSKLRTVVKHSCCTVFCNRDQYHTCKKALSRKLWKSVYLNTVKYNSRTCMFMGNYTTKVVIPVCE